LYENEESTRYVNKMASDDFTNVYEEKDPKTSNLFSKDTSATGNITSGMNQNFVAAEDPNHRESHFGDDFEDVFKSSQPKSKRKNNLLQLLSNDEMDCMQNNIMRDLGKTPAIEEEKVDQNHSGDESMEDIEDDDICVGGMAVPGNIFYPMQKNSKQVRYGNQDDEVMM